MQNEKIGFFQKIVISIKDFDKYVLLASEKISESLKYLLNLMLIFSVLISIGFTYVFYTTIQKGIVYYNNNIKSVNYTDGELTVNEDEKIVIENDKFIIQYIEFDTAKTEDSYENDGKVELYNSSIIFLKDKVIIKIPIIDSYTLTYSYKDFESKYNITQFNEKDLVNIITNLNKPYLYLVAFVSIFIYMFLVYTISGIFDIFLLTLLGYIIGKIAKIKFRLSSAFRVGVHALTLPIILNLIYILINLFTGFTIKYFGWMYTTISYIYVIVAILMIKTDIINTQIELAKIMKEQEKVRQKLKQKEEENKKDNKDTDNNKENKKEEENCEEKSNLNSNNGDEPDSSEA